MSDIRHALYRTWVDKGLAPTHAEVAAAAGTTEEAVVAEYHRLAEERVLVLAPNSDWVWMAAPFSAIATPFRAIVGGTPYWANCIWDALGVIAMLGGTGEVRTSCPDCAEPIEVTVRDGALEHEEGALVHFLVPASHWWDDIGFT